MITRTWGEEIFG